MMKAMKNKTVIAALVVVMLVACVVAAHPPNAGNIEKVAGSGSFIGMTLYSAESDSGAIILAGETRNGIVLTNTDQMAG